MSRVRTFAVVGVAAAIALAIAACGGGGGGGGGGGSTINPPPPTMTPPTVPPFVCPSGGCTSFTLFGTSTQTITRTYPTPTPAPAVFKSAVAQNITVLTGKIFHGQAATDYQSVETDTAPTQTITTNTDNYLQFPAAAGYIINIGYHSTDSNGVVDDVQYLAGNGITGQIPLGSGWSNNASSIIAETDPDGTTISETINADGSYSLTKTEVAGTTSATLNPNGTGTATIPVTGYFGLGVGTATQLTVPAQSGGIIDYTISAVGAPVPTPTPIVIPVPAWYGPSPTLASDTTTNLGVIAIPKGCVSAKFGTSGADLHQQETRLDTIFGLLEDETTDTWVTSVGPVCQRISDTVNIFYDFSGQSGGPTLGGPTSIQTNVFSEFIGLSAAASSDATRRALASDSRALSSAPQLVLARDRLERFRLSILKQQLSRMHAFLKRSNLK